MMWMYVVAMGQPRPTLLPLLRSENQLRLLTKLLLDPRRRFTITDLAEETGVPQPSVSREVANLRAAGLLSESIEHRRRVVGANTESPLFPDLASLLLKTAGPKVVIERVLSGVPRIDHAVIHGSWARRYAGEDGPEARDIDLIVVGTPDVTRVRRAVAEAAAELGRDVDVVVLTADEWSSGHSGFLRQVRAAPLVSLDIGAATRQAG